MLWNRNYLPSERYSSLRIGFYPVHEIRSPAHKIQVRHYEYSDDKYFKRMSAFTGRLVTPTISPQMNGERLKIPKNVNNLCMVVIPSYLQLCSTHRRAG